MAPGIRETVRRPPKIREMVGLAADADRGVAAFSNGRRRRFGPATARLPDPDMLLLDEPTAGLDPLRGVTFHRIVEDAAERPNATVLGVLTCSRRSSGSVPAWLSCGGASRSRPIAWWR